MNIAHFQVRDGHHRPVRLEISVVGEHCSEKMDIFTAHSLMIRPPSLLVFSVLYLALVWLAKKSLSSSQFYRLRANADLLRFKTI